MGVHQHELYGIWKAMRRRCYRIKEAQFANYGGRGIAVCERWMVPLGGFAAFVADMGPRAPGMTLERIDVNGNYEPGNCKWATNKEQGRNKRCNRLVEYQGHARTLGEWAAITGIRESTLRWRIVSDGWDVASAMTTPTRTVCREVTLGSETQPLQVWFARLGVNHQLFYARLRRGMTPEQALTAPRKPGTKWAPQ